jgi:hypothetical protein
MRVHWSALVAVSLFVGATIVLLLVVGSILGQEFARNSLVHVSGAYLILPYSGDCALLPAVACADRV